MFNTITVSVPVITFENIQPYFLSLFEKGRKATYVNRLIDLIRVYGQYIDDEKLKGHKYFKELPFDKATMSDEEIEAFLALSPLANSNIERWRTTTMFWQICAFTGCRMGEAAKLQVQDVDLSQKTFTFRDTKTSDNRTIPIPANIYPEIQTHLQTVSGPYLFPSISGGHKDGGEPVMDNVDWHYSFHSRIKRLGIKRTNLSPYSLRHSFISNLVGEDLTGTMSIVGHKDIRTTQHYYHKNLKTMKRAIEKHSLIKKQIDPCEKLRSLMEAIRTFEFDKDSRFTYSLKEENKRLMFELEVKDTP